jgi:hypothetical protein
MPTMPAYTLPCLSAKKENAIRFSAAMKFISGSRAVGLLRLVGGGVFSLVLQYALGSACPAQLCVCCQKKKNSVWSSKYSLRLILVDGSNRYFRVSRAVNSKLPRAQTIYVEHLGRVWDGIGVAI